MGKSQGDRREQKRIAEIKEMHDLPNLEYAALVHVFCRSFRTSAKRVIKILSRYGITKDIQDIEDINPRQYAKAVRTLESDYRKRTNILVNMGLIGRTEGQRNPSYRDLRERLQAE